MAHGAFQYVLEVYLLVQSEVVSRLHFNVFNCTECTVAPQPA